MRTRWILGLVLGFLASQAAAQVSPRWYDLYNASGYETLLSDWQLDAQGNLYVLTTLRQPDGNDGLGLLRYTLQGARQSVELFGLNDPYQQVGFALHLLPNNTLYILAHVREPVLPSSGAELSTETLLYLYPNLTTPLFTSGGVPISSFLFTDTSGQHTLRWFSNPPGTGIAREGFLQYSTGDSFERLLGLTANPRNLLLTRYGWQGDASGRVAAYRPGDAVGMDGAVRAIPGQFGFVADAFPVSENSFIVLWGTADQAQARMYGPDGIEAETLSMRVGYGANDALYVYILGIEANGAATLTRLNPTAQTRLWTHSFPEFRVSEWAVDSEGRAHLLGRDADGHALWRFEPDGRAHRLAFEQPLLRDLWFFDPPRLVPLSRGQWLIGSSAFRSDPIYGQYAPFHSYVGLFAQRGDANGDGCVDDADLLTILFNYGTDDPNADVNRDGIVDDADLLEVLFNFTSGC